MLRRLTLLFLWAFVLFKMHLPMRFWFLFASLLALETGAVLRLDALMALGGICALSALARWGGAPGRLCLLFGFWTAGVLAFLLWAGEVEPGQAGRFFGLPTAAFWMILGIWVVPVLIWPLGFARHFGRWKDP